MSTITTGTYKIVSVLDGERSPSVNAALWSQTQFVSLGLPDNLWAIAEHADQQTFQFGIKNRYRYTGKRGEKVATSDYVQQNLKWHVTYREAHDGYTIAPDGDLESVWTVADESNPKSEITIEKIKYLSPDAETPSVSPAQLFKFIKVE